MKETQLQIPLPGVPKVKQGREVPQKWAWTEASVWTERMLATLERGIKGGKWFSLIDKVWKGENLQSATAQVLRNKGGAGVDGQSCEQFRTHAPERLETSATVTTHSSEDYLNRPESCGPPVPVAEEVVFEEPPAGCFAIAVMGHSKT